MVECDVDEIYLAVRNVEKRKQEWSEAVDYYEFKLPPVVDEESKEMIREIIVLKRRFWDEAYEAFKEKLNEFVKCECKKEVK